ncbi:MAG: hypothetical protein LIO95_10040 [Clostridiales bacterium]|nr:hypothetical protein [Clostridiales bacterium]
MGWREIAPLCSFGALLLAGYRGAGPLWCLNLSAATVLTVIGCNPLAVLSRLLPPKTRGCVIIATLLALCALELPDVSLYLRCCLTLLAAMVAAVGLILRRRWLVEWSVLQSPKVDQTLAHLSGGGDWEAGKAWADHGCRETRALLHQAIGMECSEDELSRGYHAVYLLAYSEGEKDAAERVAKVEAQLDAKQKVVNRQGQELQGYRELDQKYQDTMQEVLELRERCKRLEANMWYYRDLANQYKPADEPESRDDAIRAYVQAGNSYQKAADKFGLSKAQVGRIVKAETVS